MAATLSKHLTDILAAGQAIVKASYGPGDEIVSFGDGTGTGGRDEITAAAGTPFSTMSVGDMVEVMTESGTNDGSYEILDITGSGAEIEVAAGSFTTEAAATAGMACIVTSRGHSLSDILKYCVIRIYSGTRPANPETTEAGTWLLEITDTSGAFVGGADTNGLLFDPDTVVDGVIAKTVAQTWSGAGKADGTATWGRLYANAYNTGADGGEAYDRIDFDVGSGQDLDMSPTVTTGNTKTIDGFTLTVPQS